MTDMTIPAPGAESQAPAAPVDNAAQTTTTPEAAQAVGTEQQTPAPEQGKTDDKEPSPGDLARKERNKQRWQAMKEEAASAKRRESMYLNEIERLRKVTTPDLSQLTDPDDIIAEKTAAKLRTQQVDDAAHRVNDAREASRTALGQAWQATVDEMSARLPDFGQVVGSVPVHDRAAPFIIESDKGGEIAYWLGKNPEVARDLYNKFESAPAQALIELGRIEARLSAPSGKQPSNAPKPPAVLSGGVSPLAFDAATASVDDMAAQLRKAGVIR